MPRKTRGQLVGKQQDIERQEREEELRALEWELHLAWAVSESNAQIPEVELGDQAISQHQVKIMPLTVPVGTM